MIRVLGLTLLALTSTSSSAQKAYVVASDQPAFAEAARAALDALGGDGELVRADDGARAVIANASVVVAVGPLADRVVSRSLAGGAHVIECLTPRATVQNNVAVPLQPASSDVFSLLKLVLPAAHRVAVFPAPGTSKVSLIAAARDAGLEVVLPEPSESFSAAVDRLVDAGDVVWIEDAVALPQGGAALVVKKASDAHKQVVGPNRSTVLQGAFFAVVPDPAAHGRAAGEAALRLLKGDDVRHVPPPNGHIVLNGALARAFGVKLPSSLLQRAETVE